MTTKSKMSALYWRLAPTECQHDEKQNKVFRLFLMVTFYASLYLLFGATLNLFAGLKIAAMINVTAAILLCAIFFARNKFNSTPNAALASCCVIFAMLLSHQMLLNQVVLHNYIWLTGMPLLFSNFFDRKTGIAFTVVIILSIFIGHYASSQIPAVLHYQITPRDIFLADIISIVLAMIFFMHLSLYLKKLEAIICENLDSKAKENAHLISILTHDISNQVTVINLACNKLKKGSLEDTVSVEKIEKRTNNIERLINGVRISQQAMEAPLDIKTVSLIDLLEDLTIFFESRFPNNSSKLHFTYSGESEYYVSVDRKILMRNVIEPLVVSIMEMTGEFDTVINFELSLGTRHVYMSLSSPALKLFNTPLLSTINAVTLPEKEAVLCVVVGKKIMNKIGGELELHPIKEDRENAIIRFAFTKNHSYRAE